MTTCPRVLEAYEAERRPLVESTQRAAQASLEWFEGISRYVGQERMQFAFNLLTRSRRVTYDNLRLRDQGFVGGVDERFADGRGIHRAPADVRAVQAARARAAQPRDRLADGHVLGRRRDAVATSTSCTSGRARSGGAALVYTEMICVSDIGRITPGCAGMYRPEHVAAWKRIVDFAHRYGGCAMAAQLGHSGRKGSTKLMWEGIDEPLETGNWEVIAPSALPYSSATRCRGR